MLLIYLPSCFVVLSVLFIPLSTALLVSPLVSLRVGYQFFWQIRTLLSTVIVHITITFKSTSSVHIISESNLIYFLLYQPSGETKFYPPILHLNHYMYDRFYLLIGVTKVPSSNPSTHRIGLRCRQPFPSPDKIGHRSFWDPNSSTLVCNISQI